MSIRESSPASATGRLNSSNECDESALSISPRPARMMESLQLVTCPVSLTASGYTALQAARGEKRYVLSGA